jgi:hypothetical protein
MNITSVKYIKILDVQSEEYIIANIDGQTLTVPVQVGNRHYDEILRQVEAGELTIADAD